MGGADIGVSEDRDNTERYLIEYAIGQKIPLLGVCRGMQFMASYFGAKLKRVTGHVRTRHTVSGEIISDVNSFHNFAIESCPPQFRVIARSSDGEIEAIRSDHFGWEGWMWHPEREKVFDGNQLARAKAILSGHPI
ncbi:gamma-glutamyl-gamma-aminobutyrate hydrolase family protein [Alphaproteobacteria bacterium]|nr:gamma-glutamyl-gamma-aminobutyrate hydrolase family protein [Alphaproteobacteria bacterium]